MGAKKGLVDKKVQSCVIKIWSRESLCQSLKVKCGKILVPCVDGSVHCMVPPQENPSGLFNTPLLCRASAEFTERK